MKHFCVFFLAVVVAPFAAQGAAGMFDQFVIVNTGSSLYYDIGATTGNPEFLGSDLGAFDLSMGSTLSLGGQGKSYKNSGSNVTGMQLMYRVYQGAPTGSFTTLSYAFQIDNVNGVPNDQQWGTDVAGSNGSAFFTSDILSGLANGSYSLEVFSQITTDSGTILNDNGGSNFAASFTVVPEPSRAILAFLGLGTLIMRRRRA
jgi:hypothetical protein